MNASGLFHSIVAIPATMLRERRYRKALDGAATLAAAQHWAGAFDRGGQGLNSAERDEFVSALREQFALLAATGADFEVTVSTRGPHRSLIDAAVTARLVDSAEAQYQLLYLLPHGTLKVTKELVLWRVNAGEEIVWAANELARIMHAHSRNGTGWRDMLPYAIPM
jgi:hypothetical protein